MWYPFTRMGLLSLLYFFLSTPPSELELEDEELDSGSSSSSSSSSPFLPLPFLGFELEDDELLSSGGGSTISEPNDLGRPLCPNPVPKLHAPTGCGSRGCRGNSPGCRQCLLHQMNKGTYLGCEGIKLFLHYGTRPIPRDPLRVLDCCCLRVVGSRCLVSREWLLQPLNQILWRSTTPTIA